ncbi:MAG: iron chelate uptake ABC transporter family permease subunit [Pseudomonadota bacterium]
MPFSALAGAIYLLLADIAARMVLAPIEISTGLVTALLGAPFFVWLVRARL